MSVTAYPTTHIHWIHQSDIGPITYHLEVKGHTVTYTSIDWNADRGGVFEQTMGLIRGREYYRYLTKKYGYPADCRTDLPENA